MLSLRLCRQCSNHRSPPALTHTHTHKLSHSYRVNVHAHMAEPSWVTPPPEAALRQGFQPKHKYCISCVSVFCCMFTLCIFICNVLSVQVLFASVVIAYIYIYIYIYTQYIHAHTYMFKTVCCRSTTNVDADCVFHSSTPTMSDINEIMYVYALSLSLSLYIYIYRERERDTCLMHIHIN